MTKDEALKLALEALKFNQANWRGKDNAITSIKWALALTSTKCEIQPAQEPVAYLCKPEQHGLFDLPTPYKACKDCFPVYTIPPQRPWVGLTDEEIDTTWKKWIGTERANKSYTLAIENALRIKNT